MSPRSFRRAHARRMAHEHRRAQLRRRRQMAAAGVIGAAALLAPQAQAANFTVTNTNDAGAGSLRDAITQANAPGGDDSVTFDPSVTGVIRLTSGEIGINADQGLTITGPGRSVLAVSGDANNNATADAGDSRVFNIAISSGPSGSGVTITGLTLTNSFDPAGANGGGAILDVGGAPLTITDSAITNSVSLDVGG